MMNRGGPLKHKKRIERKTAIRKVRPGTRRGEPTEVEKTAMREFIYALSGGQCEITFDGRKALKCHRGPLPKEGDVRERWHLVHVRAKRRFGWPTTGPYRLQGGCHQCHIELIHTKGLKPDLKGEA